MTGPVVGSHTPTIAEKWAEVRSLPPEVVISGQVGGGPWGEALSVSLPGHRLSDRAAWRAVRRAAQCESLPEAAQTATRVLLGDTPVHRQHADRSPQDSSVDAHDLISFAVEHTEHGPCYAVTLIDEAATAGWRPHHRPRGPLGRTGRLDRVLCRHRMWLLMRALRNYRWSSAPTHQVIADATEDKVHLLPTHAAVLHWWDDRLAEGHSIESARTVLTLLAPPALLARIEFTPTGHPLPRTR